MIIGSIKLKLFLRNIFLLVSCILALASFAYAENLLKNGDFTQGLNGKIPKYWGTEYYNCSLVDWQGGKAVKIENAVPAMSLGAQEVKIDGKNVKRVSLSAMVKIENVIPGPEDWNKANLQVLFFDAKGRQIEGWPEVGKWQGSFDWTKVGKNFPVPKETAKAKIVFGLYGCKGSAYFSNIKLMPLNVNANTSNLIQNGGFEVWESWAFGGTEKWGVVYENVKEGNGALWAHNDLPIWSFASQSVPLDGQKVKKIEISGFVKSNGVGPGIKPWQLARINIEFKDGKGKRIGGYPIVSEFSGTFDWKRVDKSFDVPAGTKRVDVFAGLLECSGEAWFDGLQMTGFDKNGALINRGKAFATDTSKWYPFYPKSDDYSRKTPTDLSYLLDPPAGKRGFLKVRDGHFYFDDGTRARFWGANVYAPSTFMGKNDAQKMALRLAKYGCNLVRIHHLDAFWANPNIFDRSFNDTQHLSAEALDKLDYLIYQLKERGIYIFMDLLVDREFKEGDNVPFYKSVERGAKISGLYNERIIELQKVYANQLLTHYNPYTKLRYIDDPAVVSAKLINEAMLFYIGTQYGLSPFYVKELDSKFNNWLVDVYRSREGLQDAWTDKYGRCDLNPDEDPRAGTVKRADIPLKYQRSGTERPEPFRLADTLKFYEQLEVDYFRDMQGYLKSIGLKVPISGSNHWINVAPDVKANTALDYIDRHRYWDHPQFGYGTQIVFENQSMVKNPADALPNNFDSYRVAGKPFVVSEWNCAFPNEFRIEGPIIMASYANMQDWDGVLLFSFNNPDWNAPMEDNFDMSAWPNVISQWIVAALIFHDGRVSASNGNLIQGLTAADLYGPINEDAPVFDNALLPLMTRTSISFNPNDSNGDPSLIEKKYHNKKAKEINSDTNELKWNYGKGVFMLNTPKVQAAIGFMKGQKIYLPDVVFEPKNLFSSLSVSSMDNLPISKSKKLILTAAARIENKGQKYNESKTQLANVGTAPLLVEGVSASVKLKRAPKAVRALDISGKFIKNIKLDGNAVNIGLNDKAFFYEVVY